MPPYRSLQGPANDVPLVRDLLVRRYHYDRANITELVEDAGEARRPAREQIRNAFEERARRSGSGNRVVVAMSVHGTQQPSRPGDPNEPDGR